MIRSPFSYYGAKVAMSKKIAKALPLSECYLENFVGGGSAFYAHPRPPGIEVISDANPWPVAMHTAVRDKPKELLAALPKAITVGDWRNAVIDVRKERLSGDVVRDAVTGIVAYQSSWDNSPYGQNPSRRAREQWAMWMADGIVEGRVMAAHERLQGVSIERRDGIGALHSIDLNYDWLVFCDPPYMKMEDGGGSRGGAYSGYGPYDPDGDWHRRFLHEVAKLAAQGVKFVITSGDDAPYKAILPAAGFTLLGGHNLDSDTVRPGDGGEAKPRHLLWSNAEVNDG